MKTAINNYQEDQYRENGWDHLDFGDTKNILVQPSIQPIVFTRAEIDQLEQYRVAIDKIWTEIKARNNDDGKRLRDKLYDESTMAFMYEKTWFEAQRISGKTEFELLALEEQIGNRANNLTRWALKTTMNCGIWWQPM